MISVYHQSYSTVGFGKSDRVIKLMWQNELLSNTDFRDWELEQHVDLF